MQNIRQLEAALHRVWQQQDIRRLTGGMKRRVEAVIMKEKRRGYCILFPNIA
jgi:hypothetical protein